MDPSGASGWAFEEFGHAELGDSRRTARLVDMGREACQRPSGRVSEVYLDLASRQRAYDFIENTHVDPAKVLHAAQVACARRSASFPFVFVPVDGTSLSLVDSLKTKDLGVVGNHRFDHRGLSVVDAVAVSPGGVPFGLADLHWWARRAPCAKPASCRKLKNKETVHWLESIDSIAAVFAPEAPSTQLWFQLDRGGDGAHILRKLAASGHLYTVRSNADRRLRGRASGFLRAYVARRSPLGYVSIEVPATQNRRGRTARLGVRATSVTLRLQDKWSKSVWSLSLQAVHVREVNRQSKGEAPLDWMLFTNYPVATLADAQQVVFGYTQRWRIEDFHRTWKRGACNVEQTQLHRQRHVILWATIMAAVATRVERIKHLAREQPDLPSTVELSPNEVRALILLKRRYRKRDETIADAVPTIAQATLWIAELGGYTGKSSGGPPGSTTISRGLNFLKPAAALLEILDPRQGKRKMR